MKQEHFIIPIVTSCENEEVNITLKGKTFKNVGSLKKYSDCSKVDCPNKHVCNREKAFRFFDCYKNFKNFKIWYNIFTSLIVLLFVITIFKFGGFSIFKSIAFIILGMTVFDIFFTFIEWLVPVIRENLFYYKLVKFEKKREALENKKIEDEEKRKLLEAIEKKKNNPYYDDIINAENFVYGLKKISDEVVFGPRDKKVADCASKLMEIIESLKEDGTGYRRVQSLFRTYLPEFYNMLKLYSDFVKADAVTPEYNEILKRSVDKFWKSLNEHKIAAIIDKDSTEIEFKASADVLGKLIDTGGFFNE